MMNTRAPDGAKNPNFFNMRLIRTPSLPLCPLWQPAACCFSYKWTLIKSTAIFSGQHQPTAPVQKLPASILILTIMICHLRICFETRSWPISCDQHTKSTGASILIILSRDTLIIRSDAFEQEWRQADGAFEIQKCQRFLCHNLPRLGHCGQALVAHCNVVRFPYVAVSASVIIWVPKSGESKSGQMVSEKVIWS